MQIQGMLGFIGHQMVTSTMIFSDPPTDFIRKQPAYSIANVLSGSGLRWGRKKLRIHV